MSQMEEGTVPGFAGAGLGAMARGNDIASLAAETMYADPVVTPAMVRATSEAVPAITDVEADPTSSNQGVAHRLGDLLSS
jgi:hypothetical protein